MIARLGDVIYWAGLLLAAVWTYATCSEASERGMYAAFAIAAFLLGWAIRYILSGKKTLKP
ncbi:hypothetical protein ABTI12_20325 [Acinetobacter baumannii]